ncbi:MAG: DUF1365 domain-containing protein [Arenicellales bacterium]
MKYNPKIEQSRSSIYWGNVRHRRFTPVKHEFSYRIAMLMLDLDHVERELNFGPVLGCRHAALGWFRRKDYVGDQTLPLKQEILKQVKQKTGQNLNGKVLVLTHLRYWGFIMNPISVFYCYDKEEQLQALALQVTNTPWQEKILYVINADNDQRNQLSQFPKAMHVSPFNPMNMRYQCRFRDAEDTLFFHLENHFESEKHTDATMLFKRYPLTRWKLIGLTLRQPVMTIKVGFGIYWQALRLWLKKSPVHDHPKHLETDPISNQSLSNTTD